MKQKIKIWFCDFWPNFNMKDNYLTRMIRDFDFEVTYNDPDIIFCINWNNQSSYRNFPEAIKIQIIHSEKYFNFNDKEFDYCIGSIDNTLKDTERSIYLPFWIARNFQNIENLNLDKIWNRIWFDDFLLNRKFCNFIGKTENRIYRKKFIDRLSEYKKVEAIMDGPYQLNKLPNDNGYSSKIKWTREFKYNICFENGVKIGYITEKIADSLFAKSMPIYCGDKRTAMKDFDLDEDLIIENEHDFDKAIDKIKWYEDNPHEYLRQMKKPILRQNVIEKYIDNFNMFLKRIIESRKRFCYCQKLETRTISIQDLMQNSFVITVNNRQHEVFNRIFKDNGLLPLPKKFNGICLNKIESWRENGLQKIASNMMPVIGCTISHISIINIAKAMNMPFVCIFEDDAYPAKDILVKLQRYLTDIPKCIDFLILGNNKFQGNGKNISDKYIGFNLNYGSHAYIVFECGYDKYIETLKNGNCIADELFRSLPNCYSTAECLFIQFNIETSAISNKIGLWHRSFSQANIRNWFPNPDKYICL